MRGIAFFDFDHTLISGDIGVHFGKHIVEGRYERDLAAFGKKEAKKRQARRFAKYTLFISWMASQAMLYKLRAVRRSQIIRNAYRGLKGTKSEVFYSEIPDFVENFMPKHLYPDMLARLQKHHEDGDQIVIITTGIGAVVKEVAKRYFPKGTIVLACTLLEEDGRLTGKVEGPLYGLDKANMMAAFMEARGADPQECWAYTDHYSDVHMLEAVGHQVVVNARGRLLERAEAEGWEQLRPKVQA